MVLSSLLCCAGSSSSSSATLPPLRIPKPKQTQAWVLPESEFAEGLVGGKARTLPMLKGKLPGHLAVPASVALPFGAAERAIGDPANKAVADTLKQLQSRLVSPEAPV